MNKIDIILQLWGGIFYLLAKILLSFGESKEILKRYGWFSYIFGVPAWVIMLAITHNWIALAIEAGGLPSMILALAKNPPKWADKSVKIFVYGLVILGTGYSIYDFGGITKFTQILELGVTAGFLIGTYMLAKKNLNGWLWFMLMNTSMGILMVIQEKWIFAVLQAISLVFVIFGYKRSKSIRINK